jgi:hypothetical protein
MARDALEKRAQKAILQESFFRWESAVVISLSLILSAVAGTTGSLGPFWIWLLGGALAESALVYSSLSDPEFARKIVAKMLNNEFKPAAMKDEALRQQINTALDYRARIDQAIRQNNNPVFKAELSRTAEQIDEWLEYIYTLAQRIDRYRNNTDILSRDKHNAEKRILELKRDLAKADDPPTQKQIESTLESLVRQIETVTNLEKTIQRAELQLENTLTHLATIYSQTMLVDAKDDDTRAKRLRHEIAEEVVELQDMLSAMDEVGAADSWGG